MPVTETLTLKVDTKVKQALIDSLKKIGTEGKKGAKAADDLSRNIKKVSPAPLNRLATAANKANGGLLNMVKNTTLMGYNLQGIVLVAVNKLRAGFIDMTDQYNRVIGRMQILTGSTEEATRITHKLQEAAALTGWTLDNMSDGMGKLHTGLKQYGVDADRAVELTKNFGLWMRAMGDTGKRVPKVLGNLVTMFQRSTLTLEKLETLLGRGRAEQFLGRIGENYLKIAKIDLSAPLNKGLSAMQIFDREMKKGTISFQDFFKIFTKTIDQGALFGIVATEIGHGWNQVESAMAGFITQLDDAFGSTKKVAGALSGLRDLVLTLTKNMNTVVGVIAAMGGAIVGLGLAAIPGTIIVIIIQSIRLVKALGLIKGAFQLITLALAKNPLTFFFVAATTALIVFRDEIDKFAQRVVKWVEGLKETLGILYGPIKWIVDALAGIAKTIGFIGKDLPAGKGGKKPPDKGGDTDDTTDTVGGVKTPAKAAQLPRAYTQHLTLQDQMRNLQASQAAGRETPEQYQKGLANLNKQYRSLLRTQAEDLKAKPFLTRELQHQVKATQAAADAEKERTTIMNLGSTKALEGFDDKIKNMNIALANGDLTAEEYTKKAVELNKAVKNVKVTHADEIKQYKDIKARLEELNITSEEYVKKLEKEDKQKKKVANIQGVLNQAGMQLGQAGIETAGKLVGGSGGELLATMGSAALAGSAAGPVGAAVGAVTAGAVYVAAKYAEVKSRDKIGGHTLSKGERDVRTIVAGFSRTAREIRARYGRGEIDEAERDQALANLSKQISKFEERRADDIAKAVGREREKGGFLGIGGKAPLLDMPQEIAKLQSQLEPAVAANEKTVQALERQENIEKQQLAAQQQQLAAQQQLVEQAKKQLAVMQIERDAALMEARLQSQANRDTVSTGGYGTVTGVTGGNQPVFNFAIEMTGDPTVIDARLKSDEGQRITLQTVQKNATETGEVVGASVA